MSATKRQKSPFPSAREAALSARLKVDSPQSRSASYKLAFQDADFLLKDELRPVRLQLELLKPELVLREQHIESTVVIYGSARIKDPETAETQLVSAQAEYNKSKDDPLAAKKVTSARRTLENSRYYDEARKLGHLISSNTGIDQLVVVTGGGPGIMEAANRGADEAGAPTIGFNITLPFEQQPNSYSTPDLTLNFHYFAMRKMHLAMRASALVVFPGGFGTMDELFELLTLIQTEKMPEIPIVLVDEAYWTSIINFQAFAENGTISQEDLDLFEYAGDADGIWQSLVRRGLKV